MTIYIPELAPDNHRFPSPALALDEPNGLLAFGGDLSSERLLTAYHMGIFPWYGPNEPILWWSPSPRGIFDPLTFRPTKSLRKFQKKVAYNISINHCTDHVIDLCASTRAPDQTWIHDEMRAAYKNLAQLGHCHSVEVWLDAKLVGGLYGVQVGQIFCGESMFSLASNASKIALWAFCRHFSRWDGRLIDCQLMNPHLASLGAKEMERYHFMSFLQKFKKHYVNQQCYQPQWIPLDLLD